MPVEIITSLISSVIGGVLVAIINFLLTRRKTHAEIENIQSEAIKFQAESEKIRLETRKLSAEISALSSSVDEVNYKFTPVLREQIIYGDESSIVSGYDFSIRGRGNLKAQKNTLAVEFQENCEVLLQKYNLNNGSFEIIPADDIPRIRKIRFSCDIKSLSGEQKIVFFVRGTSDEKPSDRKEFILNTDGDNWEKIDSYFRFFSTTSYQFGFFCSATGNNILNIQNIILAEKLNE
jgi:hypothetical protein